MLKIYTDILPNHTNSTYYMFTNFTDYVLSLNTHLLADVSVDNYRINSGSVKLTLNNDITINNYKRVTYIIDTNDNTCYHVIDATSQSGFIIYSVSIDYWGTFFHKANFQNINIKRTNRAIADGLYDDIAATKETAITRFDVPIEQQGTKAGSFSTSHAWIVLALSYNVEQTSFGSVSKTELCGCSLDYLKQAYINHSESAINPEAENPLMVALGTVGGIYKANVARNGIFTGANDAKVTSAYIVPDDFITAFSDTNNGVYIQTKSAYGNWEGQNTLNLSFIIPDIKSKTFLINVDENFNYYVGSVSSGLKMARVCRAPATVEYQCITATDKICVVVRQGDNQTDITSAFAAPLTLNDGDVTNLSHIFHTLNTAFSLGGVAIGAVTGGAGLAVSALSGARAVESAFSPVQNHFYGKNISGGDGVSNFYDKRTIASTERYDGLLYPYVITKCKSINNEKQNARMHGCQIDTYISNWYSLFSVSLLGSGDYAFTYVKATCNIANLPATAQQAIIGALENGVYCRWVDSI